MTQLKFARNFVKHNLPILVYLKKEKINKLRYLERKQHQPQLFIMQVLYLANLEFRVVGFCGGRKTGEPGEKPSKQGQEPTTNSALTYGIESNPGHFDGRRAFFSLRHSCCTKRAWKIQDSGVKIRFSRRLKEFHFKFSLLL